MQLPLESWVAEASLPDEANTAFSEAFRCYKAAAYRAALLFSYLGWGLTLRKRILPAPCPPGINPPQWQGFLEKLRDDERWERQVFDCTQMTQPAVVFEVSDDLRLQVKFWRNRRNDCAHFRSNEIAASHVEAFWLFVRSTMMRFVPRGTKPAMMAEISRFFDVNRTPLGSDVSPLIAEIAGVIEPGQAHAFYQEVVAQFSRGQLLSFREPVVLFEGIFAANDQRLTRPLCEYLAIETWLLVPLLRGNPSRVLIWATNRELIRRLWRELLFGLGHQDLPVYAALLRNGLVPPPELEEANSWVVAKLNGDIPAASDLEALLASDFISRLARYAFDECKINEFEWGNRNAQVIRWYVETFPLTREATRTICAVFAATPYPYLVRDALGILFATNDAKRGEFETLAAEAEVVVPTNILTADRPTR